MLVEKINFFHQAKMKRRVSGGPHSPRLAAKCDGLVAQVQANAQIIRLVGGRKQTNRQLFAFAISSPKSS